MSIIAITGDAHGRFEKIVSFCEEMETNAEDIVIIAGDAGINYHGNSLDEEKKKHLRKLPITIFAIHGNHEMRPATIPSYKEKIWHEGVVYYEEAYPNILFAKDGEIYDFNGKKTIVIGGAYSVDKEVRLLRGWKWFEDEQPSDEIKKYVESQLMKRKWQIDLVISHTTPVKYEPVETFILGIDQRKVDKSTEEWLDFIEEGLTYDKWYCGHYHIDKKIDKIEFLFDKFVEL